MLKNELINYLEANYNFNYKGETKKELEEILEKHVAIVCHYNEDMVNDMLGYILQGGNMDYYSYP